MCFACSAYAISNPEKKQAYDNMISSQKYHNEVCQRVADNFRGDSKFVGYIRSTCLLYQSERQRLVDAVFPSANNVEDENYKDQYPLLVSNFVINMNNRELETYKTVINEYCKYNAARFAKKDPQVCSAARIQSLFTQY